MKKPIFATLFFIVMVFVPSICAQTTYRAERAYSSYVNPDEPAAFEYGRAINNNGVILASRTDGGLNVWDGFTYSPPFLLANFSGSPSVRIYVTDLNDNDFKVGGCNYNNVDYVPCMWNPSQNQPFSLGLAGGYIHGLPNSINNNGKVVGTFTGGVIEPPQTSGRGFIWDFDNGMSLLGTLNGGYSAANCINDTGEVVGESDGQAFIWDAQNGMRPISVVIGNNNGWTFKVATKINNLGHIIGIGDFGGSERNFYWNGTVVYDLGPVSNEYLTEGYRLTGLNDLGQVTGEFRDSTTLSQRHAFIWDKDNGIQLLNDIVPVDGWFWNTAVDINNQGQILADGSNEDLNIVSRAYIFSPKVKRPLIFIPGVAGSLLHEADENGNPGENLWTDGLFEPVSRTKLSKLSLNPNNPPYPNNPNNPFAEVVAGDILRDISVRSYSKQYYGPILQYFSENGYDNQAVGCPAVSGERPDMFIFTYDWRLSNADAATDLKDFIECVKDHYPETKVDMVTHSMGGLIARRYILDYPNTHNINKLITTVAPWLGAAKAIDGVFTGRFLPLGLYPERILDITQFGAGPHELLPSAAYFGIGGMPLAYRGYSGGFEPFYYPKTYDFVNDEIESRPYINSADFHQESGQDNWINDNTGIKYYHFYGVQNCDETIGTVKIQPRARYPLATNWYPSRFAITSDSIEGDGTVPRLSAERIPEMQASTMIRNTALIPPDEAGCSKDEDYEHNGIMQNEELRSEIINILNNEPDGLASTINTNSGTININSGNGKKESKKTASGSMNYLDVTGIDRLDITDDQGNTNTSEGSVDAPIPGIEYEHGSLNGSTLEFPHRVKFLSGKAADVRFRATSDIITIQNIKGFGRDNSLETIKYLDLQLPVGVMAQLNCTADGVENLRYDADDDGIFETEVQPTFILTGTDAADKTPPTIDISYTVNNNAATITIDAADSETGVNQIRYIVKGESVDHIYDAPFTVTLSQSPIILVSAEDNAGNRNVLAKWLDPNAPTSSISQTPPSNTAGWNTSNVTLGLTAIDDLGGSGVDTLTYSGSGAQNISEETLNRKDSAFASPKLSTSTDVLTKTLNLYKEGITDLTFFAADKAGNIEETKTYTVKIDKGNPISQHTSAGDGQQTTFTLTATDEVSGVSEIVYSIDGGTAQTYTIPFSVSNTGGHTVKYYARDLAGNEEIPRTVYINAAQVPKSVLVSEFRTRGYLGADDEFIELYNNSETPIDIGDWMIKVKHGSASTPTVLATINSGTILPARGHYLLRKEGTSNYSLSAYAEADQTYTGAIGDNVGIALFSNASVIIDAVGFSSVTDTTYREGTALAPSTGITTNGQYSFVRNYTNGGLLIDSNNNRTDFVFVSTDGNTYNNLKAILGSPGPENLSSAIYKGGDILISQVDDNVTLAEAPNRVFDYNTTSPQYPVGILSVRRKLTNNTGNTITSLKVRITVVTTKNSAVVFPQQALLRIINSTDYIPPPPGSFAGEEIPLKGLTIEAVPTTIDGGMNSSLTLNLGPNGLANGQSLNIDLKSGIVTNGQYKLEFRVETITTP